MCLDKFFFRLYYGEMRRFLFFCLIAFVFASCSTMREVPDDWTEKQMQQRAQKALDAGNYKTAQLIYETQILRFGVNMSSKISAEFELAHIDVKKRRWRDAEAKLQKIISYYDAGAAGLPNEYLKLAQNDMEKVRQKLNRKDEKNEQ